MKTARGLGLILAALAASTPAAAAIFPVDDGASLPGRATTVMRWRTPGPNRPGGDIVDGGAAVTLILNTAPWVRRVGRIYMLLPQPSCGPVSVSWTTQGRLLPGSLVSGQRALVYAGPITASAISDTVVVSVHADGRRLTSAEDLHFQFEIDVE
jgi:hypothetical protein